MVDLFLTDYRDIKSKWNATIDASSQGDFKEVLNKIVWNQHIQSFDQNEWGQLSDFACLQKKLSEANTKKIQSFVEKLSLTMKGLEACVEKLGTSVHNLSVVTILYSMKPEQLRRFAKDLLSSYQKELDLRKRIVSDIKEMKYINSPYEVIVTVAAMWSDKVYTSDRAISHIEMLLDFEVQTLKNFVNK